MDARTLVELAQRSQEQAKEILVDLPGLCTDSPNRLADLIANRTNATPAIIESNPIDRAQLVDVATDFHKQAGTFTLEVQQNLGRLASNLPLVRLSHQPNTFAYLGVYWQFIFLHEVARALDFRHNIQTSQVHIVLDYDVVQDNRIRVSHFPDLDRLSGFLDLAAAVPRSLNRTLVSAVAKPSNDRVQQWTASLRLIVKHNLTLLRRIGIHERVRGTIDGWLHEIEHEIAEAHERSSSLSEFNAIFMSRLVNLHWHMPVVFIPGTRIVALCESHYVNLLQLHPKIVELSNQVIDELQSKGITIPDTMRLRHELMPMWYVCQKCSARVPLVIVSESRLTASGVCPECATHYLFELGTYATPNLDAIRGRMIPRISLDNIGNDILGLRMVGGVGYLGNSEHVIVYGKVASRLGLPVPPECLSRPRGIYYGLTESRAARLLGQHGSFVIPKIDEVLKTTYLGRATIIYYLLSQGFDGLLDMWEQHFKLGKLIHEISRGNQYLTVPDEFRDALENKIRSLDRADRQD